MARIFEPDSISMKGDIKMLREYTCQKCGYSAWALEHILNTTCFHCGAPVTTKPVPTFEGSFVCDEKTKKRRHSLLDK